MKGFIKVTRGQMPLLVSLNAIATVNDSSGLARFVLLVQDKKGEPEVFYVDQTYEAVVNAIEAATQ